MLLIVFEVVFIVMVWFGLGSMILFRLYYVVILGILIEFRYVDSGMWCVLIFWMLWLFDILIFCQLNMLIMLLLIVNEGFLEVFIMLMVLLIIILFSGCGCVYDLLLFMWLCMYGLSDRKWLCISIWLFCSFGIFIVFRWKLLGVMVFCGCEVRMMC